MGFGIGAALGGIAGAVAGIYSSNKSAKSAKQNMAAQLAWEQQKAKNAHQWEVEDLKKAGLNPVLSANNGASTGSLTPQMPDTSGYIQAANSGMEAMRLLMDAKKTNSESNLNDAKAIKTGVETGLMPKETAIKEYNAVTNRRRQEAEAAEAYAHVQEVMTLLPGKSEQQKQQIFEKSMQLAVDAVKYASEKKEAEANQQILEMSHGYLSLKDLKSIAIGIVGGAGYHYEKEKDRNSAKRNHRERTYNSKGKLTGETYYEYAN